MPGTVDESTYERMLQMAESFSALGERLRGWSRTGQEILRDPDVTESAELSQRTFDAATESIEAATLGRGGLLGRSLELDADALAVRATVLTYRWIDELQTAAYRSLGSMAGRAIGFLAPEVDLGGSLVSAGVIETDALDRDGVAAYLGELAASNPELMEHITSGGGWLLDSLQLRSLLTAGVPSGEELPTASAAGMRALGLQPFRTDLGAAVRDAVAELVAEPVEEPVEEPVDQNGTEPAASTVPADARPPRGLAELISALSAVTTSVAIRPAAPGRYIAYLPGPHAGEGSRRLRLVTGDLSSYAADAARTITETVEPGARVMLVGAAAGGATAAALAAAPDTGFVIDQVVTVGAPGAQAARVPETTHVLALEDRNDPVALLGGLVNAASDHRLTVVYDADGPGEAAYVAGGEQADAAPHPEIRAEIDRIRSLGYLA